jgi:hypothetical protein
VSPEYGGAAYRDAVMGFVARLESHGLLVDLELHLSAPGGELALEQQVMADADHSATFWRRVAGTFNDDHAVMFELFNEPHPQPRACPMHSCAPVVAWRLWRDGSSAPIVDSVRTSPGHVSPTGGMTTSSYIPVGQQKLYDVVQATGARNVVIIDAAGWAADPSAIRNGFGVNDYNHNVMYAVHPYTCVEPADPCARRTADMRANVEVLRLFKGVARMYPVIATELGWPRPDVGGRFFRRTYAFLNRQSPAWGSVAFAWDGSTTGAFNLLRTTAPAFLPNDNGRIVRHQLLAD